ncbi:hypothetical protein TALK_15505 [Thalassospira alkalitolerans]|uniref:Uncharacterized protein n=1 Tax=Thalassospira alkalitolerans TaxID=1293890 RepID=A0A1Y2L8F4_9PROT|nr:hypothetical protein TALK_15505 [Thalassospira alkalitolerans]
MLSSMKKLRSNIWGDVVLCNCLGRSFASFSSRVLIMRVLSSPDHGANAPKPPENSQLLCFDTKLCRAFLRFTKGQIAFRR